MEHRQKPLRVEPHILTRLRIKFFFRSAWLGVGTLEITMGLWCLRRAPWAWIASRSP